MPRLTFLGGVGTVTGSKYLLDLGGRKLLIDCGLFQGFKQMRLRNWAPLPVDPRSIDAVVLTHAHLDHSGYLPLLVRNGFEADVLCTPPTRDLCGILLPDSGFLQERDAEYANRHGFSKHKPALPLYTANDAQRSLERFRSVEFDREHRIGEITLTFRHAGHILGAAIVEVTIGALKLVFSGDLGRFGSATMLDPASVERADYLVVESTYGNRRHGGADPESALLEIIARTAARGGTVLVPAFAVGRAQTLLFHLWRLKSGGRLPDVPIFLDSPMAIDASDLLCKYLQDHRMSEGECRAACSVAHYVREAADSRALNGNPMPKIIISASGMATGGRVLHHIKNLAPDARNTILFTGFQAGGTRGASMVGGARDVKIHGQIVPIRAEVENLDMLSAHADADEILRWLGGFRAPPKTTFVTHGEPAASDALRERIEGDLGWNCSVPDYRNEVDLS